MAMKIPLLVLPAVILVVVVACRSLLSKSEDTTAHTRSGVLSRDRVRGKWKVNSLQEVHHLSESPLSKRKYIHKHTELPRLSVPTAHSMPRKISTFGKSNILSSNPRGTLRQGKGKPQLLKGKSVKQIAEDARRRYRNNRPFPVVRISKGPLKTDTSSRNKDRPQNKSRYSVQNSPHLRNWSRAIKKLDGSSLMSVFSRYNYVSPYEKWYRTNGLPQMYRDYYRYTPYHRKHVARRSVARKGVLNTIMSISQGDVSRDYYNYRQGRMRSLLDFLTNSITQKPRNTVTSSKPSTFVKAASTTETKAKGIQTHERLPSPVSLPQVTPQDNKNMDTLTTVELLDGPLQGSETGQGTRSRTKGVDQNEWVKLGTVPIKSNDVGNSTLQHQYTHSGQEATRGYQQTDNTTQTGLVPNTSNLNNPSSDMNIAKEITAQDMAKDQLISKPGTNPSSPQTPKRASYGTNTYLPGENRAGESQTYDPSTQTVTDPQVLRHPQLESPPDSAQGQPSEMKNLLQMLTRLQGNINTVQTAEPVQANGNPSVDQVRGGDLTDRFSRQGVTRSLDGPRQEDISRNSRPQQQQLAQHRPTIPPPEEKQQVDPIRNFDRQLQQQQQHQQQQQKWQQQQRQHEHVDSRGNIHSRQQPHHLQHRQRGQQRERVPVDSQRNGQHQQQQQQRQHHHQQRDQQIDVRVDSRRYGQPQRQYVQLDSRRNIQPQRQQQGQQLEVESRRRNFHDQQQWRHQQQRHQRQQQQQEQEHHREQHLQGDPIRRTVSPQQRESVPQKQHQIQNKEFHRESQFHSEQKPRRPSIAVSFARTDPQSLEIGISRMNHRNIDQRHNHKRPPVYPRTNESRGQSGLIRENIRDRVNVRIHPSDTASAYWRGARN